MAKEWILNSAMNRFQLNFKRNVGPTSESIRQCEPKTLEEWREYYFSTSEVPKTITPMIAEIAAKTKKKLCALCFYGVLNFIQAIKFCSGRIDQKSGSHSQQVLVPLRNQSAQLHRCNILGTLNSIRIFQRCRPKQVDLHHTFGLVSEHP
jgi:hypothetical protein